MSETYKGKCWTCGALIERESREKVQSLMDSHADQLGHDVSVFQDKRQSAMMDGFSEGDHRE